MTRLGATARQSILPSLAPLAKQPLARLNALQECLLQEQVPPELLGQVYTAFGAIRLGTGLLGLECAGLATQHLGVRPLLRLGSFTLTVVAILGRFLMPFAAGKASSQRCL